MVTSNQPPILFLDLGKVVMRCIKQMVASIPISGPQLLLRTVYKSFNVCVWKFALLRGVAVTRSRRAVLKKDGTADNLPSNDTQRM